MKYNHRCLKCGSILKKAKQHFDARQYDDPPGLRDFCDGPYVDRRIKEIEVKAK